MRTIKQILDRHSQEVSEAIKQRRHRGPRATLSRNERPKCSKCKYDGKRGFGNRCVDPWNCTLKRFQGLQ